ncbi:MAG: prolipoprotein diacylglyceryl transferase [Henriciella sp.]|nr:prolipoprotein diacylglyceryl transferase [Henriciella sp.]
MSLLAIAAEGAMTFPGWSPALFEIDLGFMGLGKFPVRWYALGYIAGLMVAWRYALSLIKRPALWGGTSPTDKDGIDDLLFYATLGVILGGRLGYLFFYDIPNNFDQIAADPMRLLRIWEGGMSFHGGMIGVALAVAWVARQRGVKLMSISDIGGVTAGFGIFFVRIANFVNAELYGRPVSEGGSGGMIFPQGYVPGSTPSAYDWANGEWVYSGAEVARYPSQIYEAVLEGLIPVIVASVLVWYFKSLRRPGLIAGLFLLMYGFGRTIAEQFREPDAFVTWLPDWITMGQILSIPMWIGGAFLVWNALRKPAITPAA